MLGHDTSETAQNDTNYVPPRSINDTSQATSEWEGSINPNDIKDVQPLQVNTNCTVEKGVYQGLSVIVKRS
ncbi:hypothetical protein HDU96_004372, partial [Phlyctochytrium bullatum]